MKKLLSTLSILLIANIIFSQSRLDTVFVRNIQLKGEEWWWSIAGLGDPKGMDSISNKQYKKLQKAIETANPSSSTNLTIDSLYGPFAINFFVDYWNMPEARENMGQGIDTKLRAYAPLAPYIAPRDAKRFTKFDDRKGVGRRLTQ